MLNGADCFGRWKTVTGGERQSPPPRGDWHLLPVPGFAKTSLSRSLRPPMPPLSALFRRRSRSRSTGRSRTARLTRRRRGAFSRRRSARGRGRRVGLRGGRRGGSTASPAAIAPPSALPAPITAGRPVARQSHLGAILQTVGAFRDHLLAHL